MEVLLWIVHSIQAPPSHTATRVLHWCSSSLHHTEQDRSTTDYRLGFGIRALSLIQRLLIRGDVQRTRRRVHFTSPTSLLQQISRMNGAMEQTINGIRLR